jgi:uncharacterized protein (DUF1778 family)
MSTTQREAARAAAVQVLAEQERLDVIRAKLERVFAELDEEGERDDD